MMPKYIFRTLNARTLCLITINSWASLDMERRRLFSVFKRAFDCPSDTAASKTATAEEQVLGSAIGYFDVRCTLEGRRSQWAPKWCLEGGMRGALYFELQFYSENPHDAPLETATVRIKFGPHVNSEPVPRVFTYAPIGEVSGPAMTHSHEKHREINPEIAVETAGGGGGFSGYQAGKSMESTSRRSWQLTSGKPSRADDDTTVSDVEFTWTRGFEDDYNGLNRKFRVAVVISRDVVEDMAMSVLVKAKAKRTLRLVSGPKEKKSRPLRPVHNSNLDGFENLLQNLEATVEAANHARLPQGKHVSRVFEKCRN